MAKRLVVTGASGMLGASVVDEGLRRGLDVVGFYHQTPVTQPGARSENIDIRFLENVRGALTRLAPDLIVHAAADVRVDWCEDHPEEAALTNIHGSANLAKVSAEIGARLLYVSTDSVFDGTCSDYTESDSPHPVNVYARTKLQGEDAVREYLPNAILARTNFYSFGGEHKLGLLGWILRELSNGRSLPGFTDAIFCPAPSTSVASALLDLIEQNATGIYHAVGPEAVSKYDFARSVARTFGYDTALVKQALLANAQLRAPRPLNTSLNTRKLQSLIGGKLPGVLEGLEQLAREARQPRKNEL